MKQQTLFPAAIPLNLPHGLAYREDYISVEEEQALLESFRSLPFRHSQYREYTARRRTMNYGAVGMTRCFSCASVKSRHLIAFRCAIAHARAAMRSPALRWVSEH